jgi:hypothetical protein
MFAFLHSMAVEEKEERGRQGKSEDRSPADYAV